MKLTLSGLVLIMIIAGCTEKFTPELQGTKFMLVVDGLITDQPGAYTVKLSWSVPPGEEYSVPLTGCDVTVRDDLENFYKFTESSIQGTYKSDPGTFQGVAGRKYILHINTNNSHPKHYSYESAPVEMRAVPPIDSLYYEKIVIKEATQYIGKKEGCQIYLDTFDPEGNCKFYKWDYIETWKIRIPYNVPNQICWVSANSNDIIIKNTSVLSESRVNRQPVIRVSYETDRLSDRYSIIVNQYSISEDEYSYWDKLKNVTQDVGGLYDAIPSSITGNLHCNEDPNEQVLGYFSVSGKVSKRIYVDEIFAGLANTYKDCEGETYSIGDYIPGINENKWIIIFRPDLGYVVTTWHHECADCTVRGTTMRPAFWEDF
jgi:hypothetical protein